MSRIPYRIADAAEAKITQKIHREFRHNRLALFDQMNTVKIKKHIDKLYKSVFKMIKSEFTAAANSICSEIYDDTIALGYSGNLREFDEIWVKGFFDEYNTVTKYVFSNEIDRKQSRLFESLVASTAERHQSYKSAERLLTDQVKQYAIELEDAITRLVYQDLGVKRVEWVAENDYRTCNVCGELDGQVFNLEEAPPKQHYRCRCYLIPAKE